MLRKVSAIIDVLKNQVRSDKVPEDVWLAERLDSGRFLRIHRNMIVAVDRIREVEALPNSDTLLHLTRGGPLRASRSYAAAVKTVAARLRDQPPPIGID